MRMKNMQFSLGTGLHTEVLTLCQFCTYSVSPPEHTYSQRAQGVIFSNTNNLIEPGTALTVEPQILLLVLASCSRHLLFGWILLCICFPHHYHNHFPLLEGPSTSKYFSQRTHLLEREVRWFPHPAFTGSCRNNPQQR